jgi:putative hydrolase of the HAD superfamily
VSLGYIPPAARLKLPPRRIAPWVLAPLAEAFASETAPVASRDARGLILDLDDTLYPRARFMASGFAAVAQHVAGTHALPADAVFAVLRRAHAGPHRGRELQVLCDRFGLAHECIPVLVDVFRRHLPAIWLHHDVTDTLRRLHAGGWRLAVLTNGLPSVQFRKVAALGLNRLVDEIVYAEEHAPGGKPAPAAFRAALQSLDLAADRCISVGDDPVRDVAGAKALGVRTVRLARPGVTAAPEHDADVVIDSIAQLPGAAALVLDAVTADVA